MSLRQQIRNRKLVNSMMPAYVSQLASGLHQVLRCAFTLYDLHNKLISFSPHPCQFIFSLGLRRDVFLGASTCVLSSTRVSERREKDLNWSSCHAAVRHLNYLWTEYFQGCKTSAQVKHVCAVRKRCHHVFSRLSPSLNFFYRTFTIRCLACGTDYTAPLPKHSASSWVRFCHSSNLLCWRDGLAPRVHCDEAETRYGTVLQCRPIPLYGHFKWGILQILRYKVLPKMALSKF